MNVRTLNINNSEGSFENTPTSKTETTNGTILNSNEAKVKKLKTRNSKKLVKVFSEKMKQMLLERKKIQEQLTNNYYSKNYMQNKEEGQTPTKND